MKQNEIAGLLPVVFQRTAQPRSPLLALLQVMEALHAPVEEKLGRLDRYFGPYRTPDEYVPFLAGWLDLARLLPSPSEMVPGAPLPEFAPGTGRLRDLVATAAYHAKWSGTAWGLKHLLETATGLSGFTIDEQVPSRGSDLSPRPFHIRVSAPKASEPFRGLIDRIVQLEKPAYITYELEFLPA